MLDPRPARRYAVPDRISSASSNNNPKASPLRPPSLSPPGSSPSSNNNNNNNNNNGDLPTRTYIVPPTLPTYPPRAAVAPIPARHRIPSKMLSSRLTPTSVTGQKTEVIINVYDLLPPGRLSTTLWILGTSLLHTGVAIGDREYAFGGHDRPGITGVYWTKPKTEPPGGTWRCEILHGVTYLSREAIENAIRTASLEFMGPSYNLLTRNCNHFTSHLCQLLTNVPAPAYINRAASIGVALPCVVPAGWVEPPECELEEQSEETRLTAGTSQRFSTSDDPWYESSDGYSSEAEDERRRRERRRAEYRKKGKAREDDGDVQGEQGRRLPAAVNRADVERARLEQTRI